MNLDEFDFGLPEAPSSSMSGMFQEPEAVSPYSLDGMMDDDLNADSVNPFSNLELGQDEDSIMSLPPLMDFGLGSAPFDSVGADSVPSQSHALDDLGFESPQTENTQPAFFTDSGGYGIHKHAVKASICSLLVLCFFSFIVVIMYAIALWKLNSITYDVNHLKLIIPRVW